MCVIFLVCGVKNRKFFVLVEFIGKCFLLLSEIVFLEWLFLLCDFESREEDGFGCMLIV